MKRNLKTSLLLICSFVLTLCLSVFCGLKIGEQKTVVSANTSTTLQMQNGAQVRLSSPTGLRFTAQISASEYQTITSENGTFGMFILPNAYRTTYGEINEDNAFGANAKYCWNGATSGKKQIVHCTTEELTQASESGNTYYFACSLTNIYEENYETDFFARAYYEIDGVRTWAALNETNVRSVSYVAQKVLGYESTGEYTPTENQKAALVEYVTQFEEVGLASLYVADFTDGSTLTVNGTAYTSMDGMFDSLTTGRHTATVTHSDGSTWEIPFVYADYVLETCTDLIDWIETRKVSAMENTYTVVARDIYVGGSTNGVGSSYTYTNAVFDGYGHSIIDLTIVYNYGLLGRISASAIRDLALVGVTTKGYTALCGSTKNSSTIQNVFVSGQNTSVNGGTLFADLIYYNCAVSDCIVIDYSNQGGAAKNGALGYTKLDVTEHSSYRYSISNTIAVTDGWALSYEGSASENDIEANASCTNCVKLAHNDTENLYSALQTLAEKDNSWNFDETTNRLYLCGNYIPVIEKETVEKVEYTDGVHDYTATETENYLVQNGATEYSVVIPQGADGFTTFAKDELVFFFKEATGIELSVISETSAGLAHSESAKYISIGNTAMLESAGLEADESILGSQGARIVTKDNTVYLFGGGNQGVLYAIYDFLQIVFNYDIYYYDVWEIDRVDEVKLLNFNVTDVPDVEIRLASFGPVNKNTEDLGYRFRQPLARAEYILPAGDTENGQTAQAIHNTDNILPKAYWNDTHPDWFADTGTQLCYTAHGDSEEYQAMIDQAASVLVASLQQYTVAEYPDYKFIGFMIEDDNTVCSCQACKNALNYYGANSGAVVVFCNRVMEKVQAQMQDAENEAFYREDLKLLFFAYNKFTEAPVKYDLETGEYVPTVYTRADVGVFYAKITSANRILSVYDDCNKQLRAEVENWSNVANGNISYWTYSANFHSYMAFVDTYGHFDSEGYQFYLSHGGDMFNNQGESQNRESDNFDGLKAYLDSKLQWDCTQDAEALTQKWFNGMYGDAAETMQQLFAEHQAASALAYQASGYHTSNYMVYIDMYTADYWPYETLLNMLETCNKAQQIAYVSYKYANPEKYVTVKRNIDIEWASVAYLLFKIYGNDETFTTNERYTAITDYFFSLSSTLKHMQAKETDSTNIFTEIQTLINYVYPESSEREEYDISLTELILQDDCTADDIF